MKKLVLIVAIASSFAACKKDYTCECTTTYVVNGVTQSSTSAEGKTGKMKKADAESKCNEGDFSASSGNNSTTIECKIK